jgi:hypothetical protein
VWGQRPRGTVQVYKGILGILYGICTRPYGARTRRFFRCFTIYIYIDVNLDYNKNNSRFSVDVGKLPNHVKSVSLSLDLFLFSFYIILFIINVRGYNILPRSGTR